MNVVDSSGWLEYFADDENADFFASAIENVEELLVPTITLFEVFKRILQQKGEIEALEATAIIMQGQIIELDTVIAIDAAKVSHELKIPQANSIILASARSRGATLWTQDSDFAGIPDVEYIAK